MSVKVLKIGGSCLKSPKDIKKIPTLLFGDGDVILVISAFKNITNLIELWYDSRNHTYLNKLKKVFKNIYKELFPMNSFENDFYLFKEIELIHKNNISRNQAQTLGEKLTSFIIYNYLLSNNVDIEMSKDDPLIIGNNNFFDLKNSSKKILDFYKNKKAKNILTQGFTSIDSDGSLNNLKREGSDLTAVIWAYILSADCLLYKDVGAIYSDDPNKNINAKKISEISFYDYKKRFYNSKVIQDRVIDFCLSHNLSISINSFKTGKRGTKLFI